ncbi:phosphatidylinositol-specific phospholipase C domain-containing protein [Cysteiniphilum litorale]|uniref:phosphatidylinositol-specific phospholipase C domain-containing protein n=1 Tax=Cysteiniphilum litorale TaxID=2056700 RepID=UPI003F880C33
MKNINFMIKLLIVLCLLQQDILFARDLSRWMTELTIKTPAIKLNQIIMPGSHDAGMSESIDCDGLAWFKPSMAKTQSDTIEKQMQLGTRYFDLRVKYNQGSPYFAHFGDHGGCYGEKLDAVLDAVNMFLAQYSGETIFLNLRVDLETSQSNKKAIVQEVKSRLSQHLFKQKNNNSIAELPLSQLRGSVIVMVNENYDNPDEGIYSLDILPMQGESWVNTEDPTQLKTTIENSLQEIGGWGQTKLVMVGWYLTPKTVTTPATLASKVNAPMIPNIVKDMSANKLKLANIFYYDYIAIELNEDIVNLNFTKSDGAKIYPVRLLTAIHTEIK